MLDGSDAIADWPLLNAMLSTAGGATWVVLFTGAGYFFGGLPWVKDRFHYVILAIIAISVLPIVWEIARAQLEARRPPHLPNVEDA